MFGPADFAALRSRQPGWGTRIDSIIVGPGAYVRLYASTQPIHPGRWLLPRQMVNDLLAQRIGNDLDSIQILAQPPAEEHPGHRSFQAAFAQAKAQR